ncbi:hypothetical protein MYX82_04670 [Acidobacteria bacterium AH-259-D05]|nr:hypothetical protein [Acidobacteria bacterium AH-259-D05]
MIGEHIERKLFVEKAPQVIHYIRAVPYGERSGLVAEVYDQMMRDLVRTVAWASFAATRRISQWLHKDKAIVLEPGP